MKKLVFQSGTKVFFTDDSTILDCKIVLTNFAGIDEIASEFTTDNLNGGTFADEEITNIIPVSVSATKSADDTNVTVHFINRAKTESELLADKMAELDELIAKLKGQA